MKLNLTLIDYAIFGWLGLFIIATLLFWKMWLFFIYIIGWTILMLIKTGVKKEGKRKYKKEFFDVIKPI